LESWVGQTYAYAFDKYEKNKERYINCIGPSNQFFWSIVHSRKDHGSYQLFSKGEIMRKRLILIIILLVTFLFIYVAGNAGTLFTPVKVQTKTLTMTGVRQEPSPEEPRDYRFVPVRIKTQTLTMTGMRD